MLFSMPPPPPITPYVEKRFLSAKKFSNNFDDALTFEYEYFPSVRLISCEEESPTLTLLKEYLLNEIAGLQDDWDGYGGGAISSRIIELSVSLLEKLPPAFVNFLDEDSIVPNPNGTLSIEWAKSDGNELFLEIGSTYSTYYFKKQGKIIALNNHFELNEDFIPSELLENLFDLVE